jgi:DUF2075 family protein
MNIRKRTLKLTKKEQRGKNTLGNVIPNHKYNHKYPGKDADIYCDIFLSCQWRFSKALNFLPPLAF